MKSVKSILIILAGIWTILLIIEKFFGAALSIKTRNSSSPFKLVYQAAQFFRSALLFCLIVINVFMAIALIEDKK